MPVYFLRRRSGFYDVVPQGVEALVYDALYVSAIAGDDARGAPNQQVRIDLGIDYGCGQPRQRYGVSVARLKWS